RTGALAHGPNRGGHREGRRHHPRSRPAAAAVARIREGSFDEADSGEEGSSVTLVDSSGWLEYFTDGPLAARFAPYLEDGRKLVTPTIVLYEVYKAIKRSRREEDALVAVAQLQKT